MLVKASALADFLFTVILMHLADHVLVLTLFIQDARREVKVSWKYFMPGEGIQPAR